MLPKKRIRPRSGIERAPQREWPRHRRFLRSHHCVVPGCEDGPIEVMHVRHANNAGTGIKPFDWNAVSGCRTHHDEQHRIGVKSFEAKYKISLDALAAEFASKSSDWQMKDAMSAANDLMSAE